MPQPIAERPPLSEDQFIDAARKAYAITMHLASSEIDLEPGEFCDSLITDMDGVLHLHFDIIGFREYAELAQRYRRYLANIGLAGASIEPVAAGVPSVQTH